MSDLLLIAVGAAAGALLRHGAESVGGHDRWARFPWPTFIVNVVGSAVLGGLAAAVAAGSLGTGWLLLAGTGLCGTLTTYSGFAYRVVEEMRCGRALLAATYTSASVVVCVGAAALGWTVVAG